MGTLSPMVGPVSTQVTFIFPRPKSHYRTGRYQFDLRSDAPEYHSSKPDTDKLLRAIGDALTGIVVRDDSQIAHLSAYKVYGAPASAVVDVVPLAGLVPAAEDAA
jgi:crossover junction endodeoxyribonuclease RusA